MDDAVTPPAQTEGKRALPAAAYEGVKEIAASAPPVSDAGTADGKCGAPPGMPPGLPRSMQEFIEKTAAQRPPMSPEMIADLRLIIWGSAAVGGGQREPGNALPPAGRPRTKEIAAGTQPASPGADAGSGDPAAGADVIAAAAVYTPDEAAAILKCKPSWLKEKARKRKIPFTMIGGSYRWTGAHLEEIIQMGEQRPASPPTSRAPPRPSPPDTRPGDGYELLRPRPPRPPRRERQD